MPWTEPGKKPQNDKRDEQGPPNLDDAIRQLGEKMSAIFGGKKKSGSSGGGQSSNDSFHVSRFAIIAGVIVLVLIWALSGIYIVAPAEQAVVLQFGKYQSTVGPGPHWIPRFIRSEITVNTQRINNYPYESQMLTKDQNIVDVAVAVQYRIGNIRDYLFNVANAPLSLQQATASALRQVIGNTNLDDVLTSGRAVVREDVLVQLDKILSIYKTGIVVSDVALQPARAPEQVKDAFDDAIKAQEDEQRYVNQAQAYARGVVPIAEGQAKRTMQEADAYQQQVVLNARANTARYLAVLPIYRQSPAVTRSRMYLDTMENVLGIASKIFVDTGDGNHNLLYLPFDKLLSQQQQQQHVEDDDAAAKSLAATGNIRPSTSSVMNNNSAAPLRPLGPAGLNFNG